MGSSCRSNYLLRLLLSVIFVIGLVSSDPDPVPDPLPNPNPFDFLDSSTWFDDSDNSVDNGNQLTGSKGHHRPPPHRGGGGAGAAGAVALDKDIHIPGLKGGDGLDLDFSAAASKSVGKGDDCPPCPNCPHCPPCYYAPPPPPHYAGPNKGGYSKGGSGHHY